MIEKVIIVIPVYKSMPDYLEKISIRHNIDILNRHPIVFVVPKNMDVSWYCGEFPDCSIVRFPEKFFAGFIGYNQLLLSDSFYQVFEDYEKVLICQADVFVFSDELERFCQMPYDYFGAPIGIFHDGTYKLYGGNGGFSLRNIRACRYILANHTDECMEWKANEDEFFSYCGEKYGHEFQVAPVSIACGFAFDRFPRLIYEINNKYRPFAVHGWYVRDVSFMKFLIESFVNEKIVWPYILNNEQIIAEFHSFINKQSKIAFYGAGDWGKSFLRYFDLNEFNVDCFLVSDEQICDQTLYNGKKIFHLSEMSNVIQKYGIIITTGRMYRNEIRENLMQIGVRNIYEISEELCNIVGEIILRAAKENEMHE
ncbi:DUF5672 family protein [Pectinatus frisingensis]|uniref:DUF5672 family protein n=1 Tax=Pectinatus frisingensis TaxID=865 RepID=UPI0018C81EEB|nr:DUF5672 family protein [Pectinatus frisingensis]